MSGNTNYINGNLGIQKQNPSFELDVSGSINVSNYLTVNKINENISTSILNNTASSITLDATAGSLIYANLAVYSVFSQNYKVNFINLNKSSINNQTYITTLITDVIGKTNYYYGNIVTVSNTNTASTTNLPVNFLNGSSSISISTSNTIFQQYIIMYLNGVWRVFSNVSSFAP